MLRLWSKLQKKVYKRNRIKYLIRKCIIREKRNVETLKTSSAAKEDLRNSIQGKDELNFVDMESALQRKPLKLPTVAKIMSSGWAIRIANTTGLPRIKRTCLRHKKRAHGSLLWSVSHLCVKPSISAKKYLSLAYSKCFVHTVLMIHGLHGQCRNICSVFFSSISHLWFYARLLLMNNSP